MSKGSNSFHRKYILSEDAIGVSSEIESWLKTLESEARMWADYDEEEFCLDCFRICLVDKCPARDMIAYLESLVEEEKDTLEELGF